MQILTGNPINLLYTPTTKINFDFKNEIKLYYLLVCELSSAN